MLAIYELANCFRNGWGVQKDAAAARQYYETAANLGDSDAMNEAGWCYLEGFGGKKDKVSRPVSGDRCMSDSLSLICLGQMGWIGWPRGPSPSSVSLGINDSRLQHHSKIRYEPPIQPLIDMLIWSIVHSREILPTGGGEWEQNPRKFVVRQHYRPWHLSIYTLLPNYIESDTAYRYLNWLDRVDWRVG